MASPTPLVTSKAFTRCFVRSRVLTLDTFVGFHLCSCVLHARMSGEYPHSMAASSIAENLSVNRDRSWSVSFSAGMGIALLGPQLRPIPLEGNGPKLGRGTYGIRPPKDQGLSSLNSMHCKSQGPVNLTNNV
eukprot:scaffold905_cov363-Pavlova_lutheri.AAC.23